MSAIRSEYGRGLAGEIYDFAHTVCAQEGGLSFFWQRYTRWVADERIFAAPLMLGMTIRDHLAQSAFLLEKVELDFDGEAVKLDISKPCRLEGDPTAEYVLEQSRQVYEAHNHDACIEDNTPQDISPGTKVSWWRPPDGA